MGKHWIKTNGRLWNLEFIKDIQEPIFVHGSPGWWNIGYTEGETNKLGCWTYFTEAEAKNTYAAIEKMLTSTPNFVE